MLTINRRTAELATAVALLLAVAVMLVLAYQLPPSPVRGYPGAAFFPSLGLGATAIFILVWIALLVTRRARTQENDPDATITFEITDYLLVIGATLAFVYGMDLVGFEITGVLVIGLLLWLRTSRPVFAAVTAILTMLTIWATFVILLNVPLPLLFLPRYWSY